MQDFEKEVLDDSNGVDSFSIESDDAESMQTLLKKSFSLKIDE